MSAYGFWSECVERMSRISRSNKIIRRERERKRRWSEWVEKSNVTWFRQKRGYHW